METLDLSKLEVPTTLKDLEFDQKFVGDAISYLKNIRDNSRDYVVNTEAMTGIVVLQGKEKCVCLTMDFINSK